MGLAMYWNTRAVHWYLDSIGVSMLARIFGDVATFKF